MDSASTGIDQPEDLDQAQQWRSAIQQLSVASSRLPKLLQDRAARKRRLRLGNGDSQSEAEKSDHVVLEALNELTRIVQALPSESEYHSFVQDFQYLTEAQPKANVLPSVRRTVSKVQKLALTDQRALKRRMEFLQLSRKANSQSERHEPFIPLTLRQQQAYAVHVASMSPRLQGSNPSPRPPVQVETEAEEFSEFDLAQLEAQISHLRDGGDDMDRDSAGSPDSLSPLATPATPEVDDEPGGEEDEEDPDMNPDKLMFIEDQLSQMSPMNWQKEDRKAKEADQLAGFIKPGSEGSSRQSTARDSSFLGSPTEQPSFLERVSEFLLLIQVLRFPCCSL